MKSGLILFEPLPLGDTGSKPVSFRSCCAQAFKNGPLILSGTVSGGKVTISCLFQDFLD